MTWARFPSLVGLRLRVFSAQPPSELSRIPIFCQLAEWSISDSLWSPSLKKLIFLDVPVACFNIVHSSVGIEMSGRPSALYLPHTHMEYTGSGIHRNTHALLYTDSDWPWNEKTRLMMYGWCSEERICTSRITLAMASFSRLWRLLVYFMAYIWLLLFRRTIHTWRPADRVSWHTGSPGQIG